MTPRADSPTRELLVMEAHLLADCHDPATCWYEPHRAAVGVLPDRNSE